MKRLKMRKKACAGGGSGALLQGPGGQLPIHRPIRLGKMPGLGIAMLLGNLLYSACTPVGAQQLEVSAMQAQGIKVLPG